MDNTQYQLFSKKDNLNLRTLKGHFATGHSHINYYISVTRQKSCLSEAVAVADELAGYYKGEQIDTILCLDRTEVLGACLGQILTKYDFANINAGQNIFVLTPENTVGSQIIFRDDTMPMIYGRNVLILAASVATGYTAQAAVDAINYYGGRPVGIASIFATISECRNVPVHGVFNPNDLPGYMSVPAHECPLCKQGIKIDGLVNSFGFSKI